MVYKNPSYKEYLEASKFAQIRYRYGVFIQTIAAFLLLFLLFYTTANIEEMKTDPISYAEENMGVICKSPIIFYDIKPVEINELYLKNNSTWEIDFSEVTKDEVSHIKIINKDYYYIRDDNDKLIGTSEQRGYDWLIEKYK